MTLEPELAGIARWAGVGLTAYDAASVALAEETGVQLVTDDTGILEVVADLRHSRGRLNVSPGAPQRRSSGRQRDQMLAQFSSPGPIQRPFSLASSPRVGPFSPSVKL